MAEQNPTAQRIICGDSLEVLPGLEPHSFSVAIADPPYIIGGKSIGDPAAKAGTWADMVNAASWYRDWFDMVARCLQPDAYLLVFGNWRSLPTYLCAAARSSLLSPTSCMVWDKQWIGTGGPSQLRPRWELVLWLAMPEATIADRRAPDIESEKWSGKMATSGHPAEKPVALLARLLAPRIRVAGRCSTRLPDAEARAWLPARLGANTLESKRTRSMPLRRFSFLQPPRLKAGSRSRSKTPPPELDSPPWPTSSEAGTRALFFPGQAL